jgi:hypothetical protein
MAAVADKTAKGKRPSARQKTVSGSGRCVLPFEVEEKEFKVMM